MENRPAACIMPLSKFGAIASFCRSLTIPGSVIEVGVWRGGMAAHLANCLPDRKIYLADTYTGIPYQSPYDNYHTIGMFKDTNVDDVRALFSPFPNVFILQGIFPDAFRDLLAQESFACIHLDCDMYQSYKDSLEFLYPRTVSGGIIFLDDYHVPSAWGCTMAVDEFLLTLSIPEIIQEFEGQFYFIKGGKLNGEESRKG